MLRLENISKSYLQRGLVLDDLSLQVSKGDSVAITGPSGSGKTTLLNIIGLLTRPESGDLFFNGKSILNLDPDESALYRNKNIGFVFQDHLLMAHLTVMENIMLPLFASSISSEEYKEKESYAGILMEKTGITELTAKFPYQISGGEAQRVTLVRALINKPSLLLADEPTGSLDAGNASRLGELLIEMNKDFGIALIVATHSADLASGLKMHLRLKDGKLIS
ncbi:MAG: ABC transporter ATP-binding protein [Bacteroidales bacterium]|nr:ABC transporter ATP-binding protein [Bacteroidales bacterium]